MVYLVSKLGVLVALYYVFYVTSAGVFGLIQCYFRALCPCSRRLSLTSLRSLLTQSLSDLGSRGATLALAAVSWRVRQ